MNITSIYFWSKLYRDGATWITHCPEQAAYYQHNGFVKARVKMKGFDKAQNKVVVKLELGDELCMAIEFMKAYIMNEYDCYFELDGKIFKVSDYQHGIIVDQINNELIVKYSIK